ncbi:hypothetical protein KSP40_PGU012318 [Platanthera guangdongensis]|uniref:Uncharacterized protein n=1 Tax=Platanthera guangdongensis TaxID=2320717 RepID=A0ABR2MA77_9ASPA
MKTSILVTENLPANEQRNWFSAKTNSSASLSIAAKKKRGSSSPMSAKMSELLTNISTKEILRTSTCRYLTSTLSKCGLPSVTNLCSQSACATSFFASSQRLPNVTRAVRPCGVLPSATRALRIVQAMRRTLLPRVNFTSSADCGSSPPSFLSYGLSIRCSSAVSLLLVFAKEVAASFLHGLCGALNGCSFVYPMWYSLFRSLFFSQAGGAAFSPACATPNDWCFDEIQCSCDLEL